MFYARYKNTAEMYEDLVTRYMYGDPELCTTTHFDRTYTQPVVIELTEPVPDIDLGKLAWGQSRWEKFCRQYVGASIIDWAESCLNLPVTSERGYQFETLANHDNGNCVVYMTFRNNPEPCITLLSRAAHLVPTSGLELSLTNLLASRLQPFFDDQIKVIWMAAQVQFSTMWAFPYLLSTWWPKHKDDPEMEGTNLSMRGWRGMSERFRLFNEEGVIPKYGRTANMFRRVNKDWPIYVPNEIWINGEWR